MPIEIKEMHIKINVDEGASSSGGDSGSSGGGNDMIQECMDQVAKLINDKNER